MKERTDETVHRFSCVCVKITNGVPDGFEPP